MNSHTLTLSNLILLRPDRPGDALKTLPVLRALVQSLPKTQIHIIASQQNASLMEFEPGIRVHTLPLTWKRMKASTLRNQIAAMNLPQPAEMIINLMSDPPKRDLNGGWNILFNAIPAQRKYTVGASDADPQVMPLGLPNDTAEGRDETENIAILVSQATQIDLISKINQHSSQPRIQPSDRTEALEKMGDKKGLWLGFCPTGGHVSRARSLKRWLKFITRVTNQTDFEKYFLFGLPSDYPFLEKLREACPHYKNVEICFPTSFRALGAYMERLDGVVAVDAGPLHLAAALGIRSLGFLGGGDTARWFSSVQNEEQKFFTLRRGILRSFPSVMEMVWAFERWSPGLAATLS